MFPVEGGALGVQKLNSATPLIQERHRDSSRAWQSWGLAVFDNGILYVTIELMVDIREYYDRGSHSPFRDWYDRLNAEAARKVTTALYRVGLGNFSNTKSVGTGVYEFKINFGPGYRLYFGKDGEQIVILLGGGTKQRQQNDIKIALDRWQDYQSRKKQQKEREEE